MGPCGTSRTQQSGTRTRIRSSHYVIQANSLLLRLNRMVQFEYKQYHYGTVELCQSPGKAGVFLGIIVVNPT
jgi:hypothetical protein